MMCNCPFPDNTADGQGFMKQFRKTLRIFSLPVCACTAQLPGQAQQDGRVTDVASLWAPELGHLEDASSELLRAGCFSPPAGTTVAEQGSAVLLGGRWVTCPCPASWSLPTGEHHGTIPSAAEEAVIEVLLRSMARAFPSPCGTCCRGGAASELRFPFTNLPPGSRHMLERTGQQLPLHGAAQS